MSSGKYSGFSDIAKQAMMQPQESMLEVKTKKNKLYIGIPKEVSFQENRIPLTPLSVALLINNGHEVILESNAGEAANFHDKDYAEQGATIVPDAKKVYEADIIIKIAPPTMLFTASATILHRPSVRINCACGAPGDFCS